MEVRTYSSSQARAQWRDILDLAAAGVDVMIERHGKPIAAVIAYDDYVVLRAIRQNLRADRQVANAIEKRQVLYGFERGQR